MDFIECEKPQGAGYCSDIECTCTPTPFTEGQGYIYISEALSLAAVQAKIEKLTAESGEYISMSRYSPILICEAAAKRRKLSLSVASEDAILFWGSGIVPLRATPLENADGAGSNFNEPPINQQSEQDPQESASTVSFSNPKTTERFIPEILPPPLPPVDPPRKVEPLAVKDYPAVDYSSATKISSKPLNHADDQLFTDNQVTGKSRDVSVDDVVAQYASGPLGEMAKKMAHDLKGESEVNNTTNSVSNSPGWETRLGISNPSKPKTQASNFNYTFSGAPPATVDNYSANKNGGLILNGPEKKGKKQKAARKDQVSREDKNRLLLYITIPLLVLTIIISVVVVFLKLNKSSLKTPVTTTRQDVSSEPEPATNTVEITKSFFLFQYTFDDGLYEGNISFSNLEDNRGRYVQNVREKGKTRVRTVRGSFTFSAQGITYRPDGYQSNIVWVVEEMDPTGSKAVFIDPLQENRETTKVYLTKKE